MSSKIFWYVFFIIIILAVLSMGILYFSQTKPTLVKTPPSSTLPSPSTSPPLLPTKTGEQLKIIAQVKTHTIEIRNNRFAPESLTIKKHDQVAWYNKDSLPHQIKGDKWQGPLIPAGKVPFVKTFASAGIFPYICSLHPAMKGTIIVL